MPFLLIRDDIARVHADAIVNPANEDLQEGRGTSRGIFQAAGEELLLAACEEIGHCSQGKAVITEGFRLPAKYIIHAVGPVWQGGGQGEEELLYSAYAESMKLARERELTSLAFPLISSGNYGYPKEQALRTAVSAIRDFLRENDMTIYLVVYDSASLAVSRQLFNHIEEYIDQHYVEEHREDFCGSTLANLPQGAPKPVSSPKKKRSLFKPIKKGKKPAGSQQRSASPFRRNRKDPIDVPPAASAPAMSISPGDKTRLLDDIMLHMGETFSQMLLRLIDERGLTDPEVYHRANIDRKLFSKIRNNRRYSPNKKTVLAFAIALELSLDETVDLLRTAGYSLSESSRFDVILSFFLEKKIYDIFEINEMLFYYGQPILGG